MRLPPPEVRLAVRILLVLLVTSGIAARVMEKRRLARPLPRDGGDPGPPRLVAAQLLDDVRTLASEAFEGRRTGTDGGRRARAFVAERFEALSLAPLGPGFLQPFSFVHKSVRALWRRDRPYRMEFPDAANVLAVVKGRSQPEQYFVLSAHYDHLGRRDGKIHPGADDNGSGVAALLGMAAFFKEHPPEHSLVFAAFDAEELGRQGSRAFVAAPPVPLDHVVFNLNLDMIGRGDNGRLFVAGTRHHPFLVPHLERVARKSRVALHLGHDRPIYRTGFVADWTTSSDHAPFHERGIPFLYFGVEDHPDYHRPGDVFEKIPQDFFLGACEAVLETVLTLDREWSGPGASAPLGDPMT